MARSEGTDVGSCKYLARKADAVGSSAMLSQCGALMLSDGEAGSCNGAEAVSSTFACAGIVLKPGGFLWASNGSIIVTEFWEKVST